MSLLVNALDLLWLNTVLDVLGELALVPFLVFLLGVLHELSNVVAVDTVSEGFLVVTLLVIDVAGDETLARVWDVEATVNGTLESTEDVSASGSSVEANVEEALEGGAFFVLFVLEVLADSLVAGVDFLHAELGQKTAGAEETSAVGSGVVGETLLDTVLWELRRVGGSHDVITTDAGSDDLAGDLLVGLADDETVLWSVILVLVLDDEGAALLIVSEAVSSSAELNLETRVVGRCLLNLDPTSH